MTDQKNGGHILALGGGGLSMEADIPLLDDFVLSLSRRQPPRVCFIPTASADSASYIVKFYRAFSDRSIATDLTLFDSLLPRRPARTADLGGFLVEQDIIYVGGGSTANLLAVWRVHGLDKLLAEALANGTVLAGISAGMICWFKGGVTDSYGELAELRDGLGLIDATACPHYDGEAGRRPLYHRLIQSGMQGGYAADDGAALHFSAGQFVEAVSSRPGARAYRVELHAGTVVETPLPTRYLGVRAGA